MNIIAFALILLNSMPSFASSWPLCEQSLLSSNINSILEAAIDSGNDQDGVLKIVKYENINLIRKQPVKSFVGAMKTYVEENINLEVDSTAVSTVGDMKISATVVLLSSTGAILGGSISFSQMGAQHPLQRGDDIVSRSFKNAKEARNAGYTVRTGWSFRGSFDGKLSKIGWWDPENRMSFDGY